MTRSMKQSAAALVTAALVSTVTLMSAPAFASTSFANTTIASAAAATEVAGPTTLASGVWTKKSFRVSGDWSIYEKDGQTFIELSDDFKTKKAPDLKIFLSTKSVDAVNGRNATEGAILIAPLTSHKGGQVYLVPSTIDVSDYESILIHCEAYSKLWSAATL
ncbi:MAG: DM13 domain-containing protein [Pseudomonadota bacterium]